MRILAVVCFIILTGCPDRAPSPVFGEGSTTAPKINIAATGNNSEATVLRDERDRLILKLAETEALITSADRRTLETKREAEIATVNGILFWVKILFALVGFVSLVGICATLFWSIPLGRKTLAGIGISSGAGIIAAQLYGALFLNVAYIAYIVIGLGAAIGICYLVFKVRQSLVYATSYGNKAAKLLNLPDLLELGAESKEIQQLAGVHTIIKSARKAA